jgi:hypothetical protein
VKSSAGRFVRRNGTRPESQNAFRSFNSAHTVRRHEAGEGYDIGTDGNRYKLFSFDRKGHRTTHVTLPTSTPGEADGVSVSVFSLLGYVLAFGTRGPAGSHGALDE